MVQHVEARLGDIFETEADLLVVPCSTAGTVTPGIERGLRQNQLPLLTDSLKPSGVSFTPLRGSRWQALCFAASVAGNHSSRQIIETLGTNLGRVLERAPYIHSIVTPLLGSGAGGLDARGSAKALLTGLKWTAPEGTRLTLCLLTEDVRLEVERVLSEWVQDPEEREPERVVPVQRLGTQPISQNREAVFISYSHRDRKWLERLQVHLRPLERGRVINRWDDTLIKPGTNWRDEIRRAVGSAKVAILLVSADFLASDYIANNELPPLLRAAEADGALILPVIVSACGFTREEHLSVFQAVNDPIKPLLRVNKAKQEEIFASVAEAVAAAFSK
jgi:hypothetical protein